MFRELRSVCIFLYTESWRSFGILKNWKATSASTADAAGRILVVVYTWCGDDIRLISARQAEPHERKEYEKR